MTVVKTGPRRFAASSVFKDMGKPTHKMIKRAKFWADWKKRQEAKQKPFK